MIIGVPKEIKQQEYRIALTPEAVKRLVDKGHTVLVEKSAGEGALFEDSQYVEAGARIVSSHAELYSSSELVVKVKEPLPEELALLNEQHTLFAYLHLASSKVLTEALLKRGITGIAFETVETPDGTHPLLAPMSEIAGRVATLEGAKHLQRPCGGVGKLLATFVEGELAPKVVVIGAGVAGSAAARTAAALGGDVTVLDIKEEALNEVASLLNGKVTTLISTPDTIKECLSGADLVIGAVYRSGDKAPHIITRKHLKLMKNRSVIVDIAIDQGGCVETSHPTTHSDPVFEVDGVIHYCVANMPGCVPVTSTVAISKAIVPYVEEIADNGWKKALRQNESLAKGLNVYKGKVTYEPIAKLFGLPYLSLQKALEE
jgi:alanine dehydrogenase